MAETATNRGPEARAELLGKTLPAITQLAERYDIPVELVGACIAEVEAVERAQDAHEIAEGVQSFANERVEAIIAKESIKSNLGSIPAGIPKVEILDRFVTALGEHDDNLESALDETEITADSITSAVESIEGRLSDIAGRKETTEGKRNSLAQEIYNTCHGSKGFAKKAASQISDAAARIREEDVAGIYDKIDRVALMKSNIGTLMQMLERIRRIDGIVDEDVNATLEAYGAEPLSEDLQTILNYRLREAKAARQLGADSGAEETEVKHSELAKIENEKTWTNKQKELIEELGKMEKAREALGEQMDALRARGVDVNEGTYEWLFPTVALAEHAEDIEELDVADAQVERAEEVVEAASEALKEVREALETRVGELKAQQAAGKKGAEAASGAVAAVRKDLGRELDQMRERAEGAERARDGARTRAETAEAARDELDGKLTKAYEQIDRATPNKPWGLIAAIGILALLAGGAGGFFGGKASVPEPEPIPEGSSEEEITQRVTERVLGQMITALELSSDTTKSVEGIKAALDAHAAEQGADASKDLLAGLGVALELYEDEDTARAALGDSGVDTLTEAIQAKMATAGSGAAASLRGRLTKCQTDLRAAQADKDGLDGLINP